MATWWDQLSPWQPDPRLQNPYGFSGLGPGSARPPFQTGWGNRLQPYMTGESRADEFGYMDSEAQAQIVGQAMGLGQSAVGAALARNTANLMAMQRAAAYARPGQLGGVPSEAEWLARMFVSSFVPGTRLGGPPEGTGPGHNWGMQSVYAQAIQDLNRIAVGNTSYEPNKNSPQSQMNAETDMLRAALGGQYSGLAQRSALNNLVNRLWTQYQLANNSGAFTGNFFQYARDNGLLPSSY